MLPRHLDGLNPEQAQAVRTTEGPLLVLAGAGTGKTRVVTCRIAEILDRGARPDEVCAVTFTNKAAREMRERIATLLGATPEGMVISTFHSLGLRFLKEFGRHVGLPRLAIADAGDQVALLTDALRDAGVSRKAMRPQDAKFRISGWKNDGRTPEDVFEASDEIGDMALAEAYRRYEEELTRRGLVDFDDLILKALRLLKSSATTLAILQERFRYVLVDEYQDTNQCQYEVVHLLTAKARNLCVVGDDDQSIYGWRGADPRRILAFSHDFRDATVVTLECNYRSTAPILEAANRLIEKNPERRSKVLRSAMGGGDPVTLYVAEDEKDELDYVVSTITLMRHRHGHALEDFAVLFRANSQCRPLEQALRGAQIPYRVVGTRSFFDRREVRDLLSFVRLAVHPKDDQAFLRIVNVPPRGVGKNSVDRIIEWAAADRSALWPTALARLADLPSKAAEGLGTLQTLLEALRNDAPTKGPASAVADLVEGLGYRHHLAQTVEDSLELKTRLQAVDDVIETVRGHQRRKPSGSLEELLEDLALRDGQDSDLDAKGPGVTLLTMHAAKGLEYVVVFIIGVEEGILPHTKSVGDEEDDTESSRGLEEERRLFYVGITRARRKLHLTYSDRRRRFGREVEARPSRFLEEIGTEIFDTVTAGNEAAAEPESASAWMKAIRARLDPRA